MPHIRIWWYNNHHIPQKKYSTIEIKEAVALDIAGFFFNLTTQVKAAVHKKKCVISNTGCLFCFNSNISSLYNTSIVAKQMVCHLFPLRLLNGFTDLYIAIRACLSFNFQY